MKFWRKESALIFFIEATFRQLEKNLIENINYSKIETGATTQDDR